MTELEALEHRRARRREALDLQAADLDRRRIYEIPYLQSNHVLLS
jgi:hypothetical protein